MNAGTAIEGTWQMVRAELAGEAAPAEFTENVEITLLQGVYEVRFAGAVSDKGRYELGEADAHPTITLQGATGPNAGQTIPSLYQLAGNRLRICYGMDGRLPSGFTTAAGERRYLATYRRK